MNLRIRPTVRDRMKAAAGTTEIAINASLGSCTNITMVRPTSVSTSRPTEVMSA